jgi:hypothetical protein
MNQDWQPINTAPEGVVVETKIDDEKGIRNETTLKRQGRLWFFPDDSMYVYYQPTHWRAIPSRYFI